MPFFRKNKKSEPAPEWSSFSTLTDYEDFIHLVKRYFDRKTIAYTIDEDVIIADGGDWPVSQMGLSNLAQICKQNPRRDWKSIINGHFDGMLRNNEFEAVFYERAHEYSYASPYIGVRIYPNDYISHIGEEATIKKPIAEDLSAILVFDFPHIVCNLKPETTIQWNKTNDELYETGLANIRMKCQVEVNAQDVNGTKIWIIDGNHFFVANSILDLHLRPVPTGTYGSLVGIPHRHAVLIYPIEDLGVIEALQPFVYILQGMYAEGPGSISQSLYWHRSGQLTNLPYNLEDNNLEFKPPAAFLEVMNLLQAKK
jgi:hypothetical protein